VGVVISTRFCDAVSSEKVDPERPSVPVVEPKHPLTKLGCFGSGLVKGGAEQDR